MPVIGNEDHKQRVNLSGLARAVIELDQSALAPKGSLSGFLNRIISAFRDSAEASVDLVIAERQTQLLQRGYPKEIVNRLTEEYRQQLMRKVQEYPQGDSLMFRLNNQNFDLLYEEMAESTAYSAPSKYLKALLEEYARLSPSERERVYFAPMIRQQLEPALKDGSLLEITAGGTLFWLKPHSLMADPFNAHLYLVGIICRTDTGIQTIASFRISRLEKVKVKKHSGKLTAEERHKIENRLRQVGVQYLVGEQDTIRIRLTPAGQKTFSQRNHLRPVPVDIQGDVYCFCCSPMQIRNYFLAFGRDAEVLEPASLRKIFNKFYCDGAKLYATPAKGKGAQP